MAKLEFKVGGYVKINSDELSYNKPKGTILKVLKVVDRIVTVPAHVKKHNGEIHDGRIHKAYLVPCNNPKVNLEVYYNKY